MKKIDSPFLYCCLQRGCCCHCPDRLRRLRIFRFRFCFHPRFFGSSKLQRFLCGSAVRQRGYRRFHLDEERGRRSERGIC